MKLTNLEQKLIEDRKLAHSVELRNLSTQRSNPTKHLDELDSLIDYSEDAFDHLPKKRLNPSKWRLARW